MRFSDGQARIHCFLKFPPQAQNSLMQVITYFSRIHMENRSHFLRTHIMVKRQLEDLLFPGFQDLGCNGCGVAECLLLPERFHHIGPLLRKHLRITALPIGERPVIQADGGPSSPGAQNVDSLMGGNRKQPWFKPLPFLERMYLPEDGHECLLSRIFRKLPIAHARHDEADQLVPVTGKKDSKSRAYALRRPLHQLLIAHFIRQTLIIEERFHSTRCYATRLENQQWLAVPFQSIVQKAAKTYSVPMSAPDAIISPLTVPGAGHGYFSPYGYAC